MSRWNIFVIAVLLQGLASSCATQEPTPSIVTPDAPSGAQTVAAPEYAGVATGIQLEKAVHFSAPEGEDILAAPGHYQVEPTVEAHLRLIPEGNQPPIVIAALTTDFDVDVSAPIALTLSPREDIHHVVLLLPGGTALDGIGTYTGVKMRAPFTAAGTTSVKTTLNAKLAGIKTPAYTELPKVSPKFEARASDFTVQPGQRTTNFEECKMAGSGYVGSVIAQQTVAVKTQGALPLPPPMLGGFRGWDRASVILTGAPGAPPPTPSTGTTSYVTTNPRTPYLRDVPRSTQRCVFGSAVVTATGLLPLQPGERVKLLVTSKVIHDAYVDLWIEDAFELTAQGGKSLTFPKVIVASATAGVVATDWIKWQDLSKRFVERMRNGLTVGFALQAAGKRIACQYKPDLNNFGQGNVTCPPGMPWPIQQ